MCEKKIIRLINLEESPKEISRTLKLNQETSCEYRKELFLQSLSKNDYRIKRTLEYLGIPSHEYTSWTSQDYEFRCNLDKVLEVGKFEREEKDQDLVEKSLKIIDKELDKGNINIARFVAERKGGYSTKQEITTNSDMNFNININYSTLPNT